MNIVMMTNTYLPHVGGVARSVEAFSERYRRRGHRVLVVAPEFEHMPSEEQDVVRVAAIQHFNGSDFSVALPVSSTLGEVLEEFQPQVIHSHHPFLLGATAVRYAYSQDLPLVFTHHTMYEQYTHYVPGDSPALKRAVVDLSTGYANLCQQVIAPSESIAEVLRSRGVETPIDVVPTGVDLSRFSIGSGNGFRLALGIPSDAFLVGHTGRLAPEKNLDYLMRAVAQCLQHDERAHFLVVGVGPSETEMRQFFDSLQLGERFHIVGLLEQRLLASAYAAMDIFAFASKSETQGMVLTEAMAMGTPVIALDAPGVREVVTQENGRLLYDASIGAYADTLLELARLNRVAMRSLGKGARKTAEAYSLTHSVDKALALYARLIKESVAHGQDELDAWHTTTRLIEAQWMLLKSAAHAATSAWQPST